MPSFPSPGLESLTLDTTGWTELQREPQYVVLENDNGDRLIVQFLAGAPPEDYPRSADAAALHRYYDKGLVGQPAALVEVAVLRIGGLECAFRIYKLSANDSLAMIYSATFEFSFADCCYVVMVQSLEQGTTGVREAVVAALTAGPAKVTQVMQGEGPPEGVVLRSAQDVTDFLKSAPVVRLPSDDAKYDELMPDHPLSRVRRCAALIEKSIGFAPEVLAAAPFWARK